MLAHQTFKQFAAGLGAKAEHLARVLVGLGLRPEHSVEVGDGYVQLFVVLRLHAEYLALDFLVEL